MNEGLVALASPSGNCPPEILSGELLCGDQQRLLMRSSTRHGTHQTKRRRRRDGWLRPASVAAGAKGNGGEGGEGGEGNEGGEGGEGGNDPLEAALCPPRRRTSTMARA